MWSDEAAVEMFPHYKKRLNIKMARRWFFFLYGTVELQEKPIHHPVLHTDTHWHKVTEATRSRTDCFFPLV